MNTSVPALRKFNLSSAANHRVDVMFLADATGSMQPAIANVQANIVNAWKAFSVQTRWDVQIGIAFYRDSGDATPFQVVQQITSNTQAIQSAANGLVATGGGDRPEGQLYALTEAARRSVSGWRIGSTRIIAWFGDEYAHDPVTINGVTCTLPTTIDALQERNVYVCAFSVLPGNNLDGPAQQATKITTGTDGFPYLKTGVAQQGVVDTIFKFIAETVP